MIHPPSTNQIKAFAANAVNVRDHIAIFCEKLILGKFLTFSLKKNIKTQNTKYHCIHV